MCIVALEDVPGGPRKGRARFPIRDDDPTPADDRFAVPPLDADAAADRISRLGWAEDQRIQAGLVGKDAAEDRLERATVGVLMRVPQLQQRGTRQAILEKAERNRDRLGGPRALPAMDSLEPRLRDDQELQRYEQDSTAIWARRAREAADGAAKVPPWVLDVLGGSDAYGDALLANRDEFLRIFEERYSSQLRQIPELPSTARFKREARRVDKTKVLEWLRENPQALKRLLDRER